MSVGLSSDLNWTEVGRKEIKSQDLGLRGPRAETDRPTEIAVVAAAAAGVVDSPRDNKRVTIFPSTFNWTVEL